MSWCARAAVLAVLGPFLRSCKFLNVTRFPFYAKTGFWAGLLDAHAHAHTPRLEHIFRQTPRLEHIFRQLFFPFLFRFFWRSWGGLGVILARSWGILGRSWGGLGLPLGGLGAVLGSPWAVLRGSWAVLGMSWPVLKRSWGDLGRSLGGLGLS